MLRRCGSVVLVVLGLLLLLSSGASASLSDLPDDVWAPNGDVLAAARSADWLYLGGTFTRVAPVVGGFARFTATSEAVQGPSPAPALAASSGGSERITAVIDDGAGGFYLGGHFDTVGAVARRDLAHIRADGTLDPAFAPDPDGPVRALARRGSTIYVAGTFTTIGGAARNGLAAVDGAGHATAWAPAVDAAPLAIAATASTLYLGGQFTTINGDARPNAGAVDATTGATTGWDPQPDASVDAIAPAGAAVYLGGSFTHVHTAGHTSLAKVDATTGLPAPWSVNVHPTSGSLAAPVAAIAVDGARVLVGGAFDLIGGVSRHNAAAVDATTGATLSWDPDVGSPQYPTLAAVAGLAVSGSTVYLTGSFFTINGSVARTSLAAVDATTGTAQPWAPWLDTYAFGIALSGDKIGVAGGFRLAGGVPRQNAAALDMADGTPTSWNPKPDQAVRALALDGANVFLAGDFAHIANLTHHGLAKVDATAGVEQPWGADLGNAAYTLALSGRTLYVGGLFSGGSSVGTATRGYAAAVDADTGAVEPWDPEPDAEVDAIRVAGDTVYLGGGFSSLHATTTPIPRAGVAAISSGGTVTGWSPGGTPSGVLATSGSSVFLAGSFPGPTGLETVDGTTAAVGAPAVAVAAGTVDAVADDAETLFLGGSFTAVDGAPRTHLAAIDLAGGGLRPWQPADVGAIRQLAPDGRGGVVTAPGFASFSGLPTAAGAPLLGGSAAVGSALTCANATWGGSIPQRYAFSWLRDGAAIGAAGTSYAPTAEDAGHALSCRVTATNLGGSTSADSAAATVAASGDGVGTAAPVPGAHTDAIKPVISALRLAPRSFLAERRGASTATAAKRRGTAVSYRVSEAATVVFTVQRRSTGRRAGRSCAKATKRLRHARRCTRYVAVKGSFTRKRATAGTDKLRFTGRLGGHTLAAGAYRLTLVATDPARNRSAAASTAFTIKKR